jgi:hypothetical protein
LAGCVAKTGRYVGSEMSEQDTSVEQILMEANIREFGHAISLICALEVGGKITPEEAYKLIKKTWHDLKLTRKSLFDADKRTPPQC